VVGRRGENFGVEKRWEKNIYAGREDGIFVHPKNGLNGLIRNWCIGGCWVTLAIGNNGPFSCTGARVVVEGDVHSLHNRRRLQVAPSQQCGHH